MTLVEHGQAVRCATLGTETRLDDDVLSVNAAELAQLIEAGDRRIVSAAVHIASPGDAVRIVCTKDVIQPRTKLNDSEHGQGESFVLDRVAVVTCGPIVGFQEGIIDMQGPGADYTPFSKLSLVVIETVVEPGISPHEHEAAVRGAGLFAAEYLAQSCAQLTATQTRRIDWGEDAVDPALPKIAYVDMVLTQGLLHDTYVLGRYAGDVLPAVLDPRVLIDGGIVSGNCVSACDKNTTYHHQSNPVIAELLKRHGHDLNFVGVVVTNEPTRLAEKQQTAERTVALVRELAAQGAIVTKEGFGNPDADLMMIVRGLEFCGIATVAVSDEFAGRDGSSQSLADVTPEADALISVGNANEKILLPPMHTVIGPLPDVTRLAGGYAQCLHEDGSMEVELQAIVGSTNQLGFGNLSCRGV